MFKGNYFQKEDYQRKKLHFLETVLADMSFRATMINIKRLDVQFPYLTNWNTV